MHGAKRPDGKTNSPRVTANLRPNYGVDSPGVIRTFFIIGGLATIAGAVVPQFTIDGFTLSLVGPTLLAIGVLSLTLAASTLAYAFRGKFNVRDRMLGLHKWKGDEAVLDVGTGRGLLAIGAAKRLKGGTATGIDLWESAELSGNTLENTLKNVSIERVEDSVEIKTDDARSISFVDKSFDVVLSLLYIHNIASKQERELVCQEIARVLKRGGTAIIADYANMSEYAKAFTQAGLKVERPRSIFYVAYTPLAIMVAKKP